MNDRILQLVLKLRDDASKEFKNINVAIAGAERQTSLWNQGFALLASSAKIAAGAITAAAVAGITMGVRTAAELQTARQGFVALLGSAEEADAVITRIKEEAKATPFEIAGLTIGAQALTAITKDGQKAIDTLLDVGKAIAVSGKGQAELDRVIFNLQQVSATGKVTEMDIRQFQGAIPIFNDIILAAGLTTQELKDSGNAAELLFEAFHLAASEGGIAAEGFSAQAGTFNQALSNLKDTINTTFADIVQNTGLFQGLTDAMIVGSDVIGNWETILPSVQESFNQFMNNLNEQTGLVDQYRDSWERIVAVYNEHLGPSLQRLMEALKPLEPIFNMLIKIIGVSLVFAIKNLVEDTTKAIELFSRLLSVAIEVGRFFVNVFVDNFNAVIDTIAKVITWVEKLIDKFKEAIALANQIGKSIGNKALDFGSSLGRFLGVNDAIITPDGKVIKTNPADYLIATKRPQDLVGAGAGNGGPIHIHLSLDGREVSEVVFNHLMGDLKSTLKLTQ